MKRTPREILPIVGIIVGLVLLALWTFQSCSPDHDAAEGPGTSDSSSTDGRATQGPDGSYTRPPVEVPVETDYSPPPTPSADGVPKAAAEVATRYIRAKENQNAYYQSDLKSWTREVDDITGPLVKESWKEINVNGNPGYPWTWAHQERVKTDLADVVCRDNPEVPSPNPAKMLSIRCTWIAMPVYDNGSRVPPNKVDFTWEWNGPRGPMVLSMVNDGGWKVTMDATGIAQ